MLPPSAERVADIASFSLPASPEDSLGPVTLVDGRVLSDIDRVVLCTGYHITVPFLPSLHNDALTPEQADEKILVTDGSQFHNLHRDIFYISDPTLAVVGVPFYTCTFTLFDIQALVVSKVLSGQAWVPNEAEMRKEYNEKVEQKGYGRPFHSLMGAEVPYVASLVEWVNSQVPTTGGEVMEGHTEAFLNGYGTLLARMKQTRASAEAKLKAKKEKTLGNQPKEPTTETRGVESYDSATQEHEKSGQSHQKEASAQVLPVQA